MRTKSRYHGRLTPEQYKAYLHNWHNVRLRRFMWERLKMERQGSESLGDVVERLWQMAHAEDTATAHGFVQPSTETEQ